MSFVHKILFVLSCFVFLGIAKMQACSFTPSFKADTVVCYESTVLYEAQAHSGNTYAWSVTNGKIISGATSSKVYVEWSGTGTGSIKLVESSGTCKDSVTKTIHVKAIKSYLTSTKYSLNGYASQSGKTVTLTKTVNNEISSVWYPDAINLENDFDLNFQLYICGDADGMIFVLQNDGPKCYYGGAGGSLNYFDAAAKNIMVESFGVEFDIYKNGAEDSSSSHISLAKNTKNQPLLPQYEIKSPSVLGKFCKFVPFRIKWTAGAKLVEIWFNSAKIYTYHIDLEKDIFKSGPKVYFGFCGATGGLNADQQFYADSLIVYNNPINVEADIKNPAKVCSGNSITYTFNPPAGYSNSDYGKKWSFSSLTFKTDKGTIAQNYKVTYPSSSGNGQIVFTPNSKQEDSIYLLNIITKADNTLPCDSSWAKYIAVYTPPKASFKVNSPILCKGSGVKLINTSTPDTTKFSGKNRSYIWYFGDGNRSKDFEPLYYYADTGAYTISLVVDNGGCKDSTSMKVHVYPSSAGADFLKGTPYNGYYNNGTERSPDHACTNDTLMYEIHPPSYYTNADYGTLWKVKSVKLVSYKLETPLKDTATFAATKNSNFKIRMITPITYGDSMLRLRVTVTAFKGGCDTTFERILKVSNPPVANFTYTEVCVGQETTFSDSSDRKGSSYLGYTWYFGDGGTATQAYSTHTYSKPGVYDVMLRATNSDGCSDVKIKKVKVYAKPEMKITTSPACAGEKITFYDASITDGKVLKYSWTIGNYRSSLASPTFQFNTPGKYNVTLAITVSTGCIDTLNTTFVVQSKPKADFVFKGNCIGDSSKFENSTTPKDTGFKYLWDFGDGTTSTLENPSKIFFVKGTYEISLTVSNSSGCVSNITKKVSPFEIPVAAINLTPACEGNAAQFEDKSNYANSSHAYTKWYFGDGETDSKSITSHVYKKAGTYTVSLAIKNGNGCMDSTTKTITINPIPVADFTATTSCLGQPTLFTNKSKGSGGTIIYEWNFGDTTAKSTEANASHIYKHAGTFNTTLKITENGCSSTKSMNVTVNPGPVPDFSYTNTGKKANFKVSNTTYKSYTWSFGDGDSSTDMNPVHLFPSATGSYKVTLKIVDNEGCSGEKTMTVDLASAILAANNNLWDINIYPNPFNGNTKVNYTLEKGSKVRIVLTDLTGRELIVAKEASIMSAGKHQSQIEGEKLAPGLYILKIFIDNQCYQSSVIKQ